jgi:hypothetical protein
MDLFMLIRTFVIIFIGNQKLVYNWWSLIMVESCCFICILISFLRFDFKLGSFHFVGYFSKIIFIELCLCFAFVKMTVFLYLCVCTFELALYWSHTHFDMWLLKIMFLIINKLFFTDCLLGNISGETTFGTVNLVNVWFIMFFQVTSWVLIAPLNLMSLRFSNWIQLLLYHRQ